MQGFKTTMHFLYAISIYFHYSAQISFQFGDKKQNIICSCLDANFGEETKYRVTEKRK